MADSEVLAVISTGAQLCYCLYKHYDADDAIAYG